MAQACSSARRASRAIKPSYTTIKKALEPQPRTGDAGGGPSFCGPTSLTLCARGFRGGNSQRAQHEHKTAAQKRPKGTLPVPVPPLAVKKTLALTLLHRSCAQNRRTKSSNLPTKHLDGHLLTLFAVILSRAASVVCSVECAMQGCLHAHLHFFLVGGCPHRGLNITGVWQCCKEK